MLDRLRLAYLGLALAACSSGDGAAPTTPANDAGGAAPAAAAGTGSEAGVGSGSDVREAGAPAGPYRTAVLADAPVAYWRFGETSGATARDEIGNAHPGTFYGSYERGVPGITGEDLAASFDGATGCVGIGSFFHFPGRVAFSVEAWVKLSSYGAEGTRIVSTEGVRDGNRSGWNLSASYGDTGYPYFDAWNSNTWVMGAYSSTSPDDGKLKLGQWSYLVGTFDDAAEEIWVDGVLRNHIKQTSLGRPDDGFLTIGCEGTGSGRIDLAAKGAVDEVAIYDKVLTPAQIANHWGLGRAP